VQSTLFVAAAKSHFSTIALGIFPLQIYPKWIYILSMVIGVQPAAPLSPAVLAILLSLAEGDKHGYAMMKEARSPRGGGIAMGPGTLYGSIDRMIRDGLVEESGKQDDERRRYYRLTAHGRTVLAAECERLDAAVSSARALGLIPNGGRS
jgi:DNA-binding PadR family transcriptional regulator